MSGRLPNHNFNVFFTAISIINQASRLIFGIQLNIKITRKNTEKKLESSRGRLPNPNFNVFFIAISRNKQARRLVFVMLLDINLTR